MVKPIYSIALVVVILLVFYVKFSNPHRKYSTREYWQEASIESLEEIPSSALEIGNKNGPILMWAAMVISDPRIISILIEKGADINEPDLVFKGTPLTAAAGYSSHPKVIEALIISGSDINKVVGNNETALMIAAQYNQHPNIITTLLANGALPDLVNAQGETALEMALKKNNQNAVIEFKSFVDR